MLRALVAAIGVALCGGGLFCIIATRFLAGLGVYVLVIGVIILASLFFEPHYRARMRRGPGAWKATGERFIDPGTNKLVEVFYNEATGQREYRDAQ